MDLRRPVLPLLSSPLRLLSLPSAARGHKTTARTKRALKIAPHDSFLPLRPSSGPSSFAPAADSIIYNPPSSAPTPANTPFLFLPSSDARRDAITRLRTQHFSSTSSSILSSASSSTSTTGTAGLPPALRYKRREPRYHLQPENVAEMRRLRADDPLAWSVGRLAAKFDCSTVFVRMAAPAPREHLEWLRRKMDMKVERWGPIRRQAREDRKRRAEMLYRGEL
ncbi:54S ribosomal protein L20 [Escovopsis weberi]|uniref:54S ribosomal protein L20 n=1 Tax=Escovopsis weberi TaxID=150374 RepID=A0A0M9VXH7_ESCWE|nr:54S ribosomal protein L20 [Escovopsis weberi]